MVVLVFQPLHARFDFTLEDCIDDEGINSHGDLPHCSPSDLVLERELSGERVFINSPWEFVEHIIGRHFETCRRASLTSAMVVFVFPKWAKFRELTRYCKPYQ
jgi:hypothetical protein